MFSSPVLESLHKPSQTFLLHPRLEQLLQSPKRGHVASSRSVSAFFFLAYLLFLPPSVRRRIGQSFTDNASQTVVCPVKIINTPSHSIIIPEIELSKVSVKMLFIAMMVYAIDASLEDREIPFNGIPWNACGQNQHYPKQ